MQHKVPQFIDIEDKIFGPFTLKQFAYLAGGIGLSIIIWRSLPLGVGIFLIAPTVGLTIALMFLKPNGKPFIFMIQNFLNFFTKPRVYSWQNPNNIKKRKFVSETITPTKETNVGENKSKAITRSQIEQVAKNLNSK